MWLEDIRNGTALMITHQERIGIRGMAPGAKEERELGWFGWSIVRDISRMDARFCLKRKEMAADRITLSLCAIRMARRQRA